MPPTQGAPATSSQPEQADANRSRLSRLVPVDVGLDPSALRARYPDRRRFVIAESSARLIFRKAAAGRPARVAGVLDFITPSEIYVPKQHRTLLDRLAAASTEDGPYQRLGHDPRYVVTVKFGAKLQPWVESVEELTDR